MHRDPSAYRPRRLRDTVETQPLSRRSLIKGAALSAGALCGGYFPFNAVSAPATTRSVTRKLIRNATVVTGTTAGSVRSLLADILIVGERIADIGPHLNVTDAEIIDATGKIAIPGFIDSHRHMWQGCIRQKFPNDSLNDYFGDVLGALGPRYRPEDVYIGDLVSALSAIDAGITTILDYSHISNTPQHTDAAIAALKASGMRAVFGYGSPELGDKSLSQDTRHRYPSDIKRLRTQYFSTEDQLLTLALAADGPSFGPVEPAIAEWEAARDVDARIAVHVMGAATLPKLEIMQKKGLLKAETTYIHCTNLPPAAWKLIKETGASVSLSSLIEMEMGHGIPAIQQCLDHDLMPSLSVDVETTAPNDMFTQMRSVFSLQRALLHQRVADGETNVPRFLQVADVFLFATLAGARANGLERKVGSLDIGRQADIVLLDTARINVLPVVDTLGAIVLGMDTGNVDSVYVAGKALKQNGRLLGVDMRSITARAAASQEYLLGAKHT